MFIFSPHIEILETVCVAAVRRTGAGAQPGIRVRAPLQAEVVEHAEYQGSGAVHQDAVVAQRPGQHGQAAGHQKAAGRNEEAEENIRRFFLRQILTFRHLRPVQQPRARGGWGSKTAAARGRPRPQLQAGRGGRGGGGGGADRGGEGTYFFPRVLADSAMVQAEEGQQTDGSEDGSGQGGQQQPGRSRRKPAAPQWLNPDWEGKEESSAAALTINGVCVMNSVDQ